VHSCVTRARLWGVAGVAAKQSSSNSACTNTDEAKRNARAFAAGAFAAMQKASACPLSGIVPRCSLALSSSAAAGALQVPLLRRQG